MVLFATLSLDLGFDGYLRAGDIRRTELAIRTLDCLPLFAP